MIEMVCVCVRVCLGKKHVRGISYHHPPSRIPETDVFCRESQYPHGPFIFPELNIGPPLWLGGKMTWRKEKEEFWQLSKDPEKNHANQNKSNRWSMVFKGIFLILHIGVAFSSAKTRRNPIKKSQINR